MRLGRILPGVAALDGKIFVVGGEEESQILANGECYDSQDDTWNKVKRNIFQCKAAPMRLGRVLPGVAALDGKIFKRQAAEG